MKFNKLCAFLDKIEKTSSRNAITIQLSSVLKILDTNEIKQFCYLVTGKIVSNHQQIEFNFSEKLVEKSLEELINEFNLRKTLDLKKLKYEIGDIGEIAKQIREQIYSTPTVEHNINDIYSFLIQFSQVQGKNSVQQKKYMFKKMIVDTEPINAKFLTRIILGQMRTGFTEKTFLDAISILLNGDKSLRNNLDIYYGYCSDIGTVTENLISTQRRNESITNILNEASPQPLIPILPKLVEREVNVQNITKRIENVIVQPKLDGIRGQIHKKDNIVKIFSRGLEDITNQFPEIATEILNAKIDSVILDCEIIGFDFEKQQFLTYQETIKRKRKFDIDLFSITIPTVAMCFDIIYFNGSNLANKQLRERINLLTELFTIHNLTYLRLLETKEFNNESDIQTYFENIIANNLEGIIAKNPNSFYIPGTRNFDWIKLKSNTVENYVDTIDVVTMGYYLGKGNRSKFGFGAILVGVYDEENDCYTTIGKIGSGFSEEEMNTIFKDLQKISITEKPQNYLVDKSLYPNVWTEPKIVLEIQADEITVSPLHTACRNILSKGGNLRGLSVRFPRLKVWKRDKILPNTTKEIFEMYKLQKSSKKI
ncbi:MAG: ATP-dependent DNA ligase [Candidatus Dojkabacteria bacterium]|nr:ATP-dependent DNA ligase [Candidatus Dojkabacteria bacterium]